jgi:predicted dehydrogenase
VARSESASSAVATWARPMRSPCPPSARCSTPACGPAGDVCAASAVLGGTLPRRLRLRPRRRGLAGARGRPEVEAVVIASPQTTHRAIAEAAFALGKPVFCEKPLGASLDDAAAPWSPPPRRAGLPNMIGFNYVRTPATQFVRQLLAEGAIGEVTWFRGEHTEDFSPIPRRLPTGARRAANGTWAISPHMINCALALMGRSPSFRPGSRRARHAPRARWSGSRRQRRPRADDGALRLGRDGPPLFQPRRHGAEDGLCLRDPRHQGAIRFDQEDQNAVWLYRAEGPEATRGFTKILTGPAHPDYLPFCQGPGHGTGYQDQIIIEARDFLRAIETGNPSGRPSATGWPWPA